MDKITSSLISYNKLIRLLFCCSLFFSVSIYAQDTDGDTIPDFTDLDDDNDGILDRVEGGCDTSPIFAQIARWDPNINIPMDVNSLNGNTGAAKADRYEPSFANSDYVDLTVSNLGFGSGLTDESLDTSLITGNDVASHGYIWVSGVDGTTVADARTNNDYLDFSFTVRNDVDLVTRFDNLIDITTNISGVYQTVRGLNLSTEARKPIYADWSYQIEISPDNFTANSQILQTAKTTTRIQDGTAFTDSNNDAGGGVNAFNEFDNYQDGAGPNNDVLLQAGTTYTIRIYLFAAEDAGNNVTLDNFNISINPCTEYDTDNDGIANIYDLDSDNDGCADLEEAGGSFDVATDGVAAQGTLTDGNGGAVTTNLGNSLGATLAGVPDVAGGGQGVGNTQDGINYCEDFDDDGVPDEVDLDDDNDGILDEFDVCDIVTTTVDPLPAAVNWEAGGFRIFTIGGNTDATGAVDNGFQQAAIREGVNINTLSSASDYTTTGSVGGGTADTSVITFSNGTITYLDTYAADAEAELRTTTAGGFISGDTGSGVYVESEFNGGVDDEYTVSYNFTTPVTLFSVDMVDIFDTFGTPPNPSNPILQYEIIADGKLIAFLRDEPTGDDTVGTVDIFDSVGNLRGSLGSGQNIETTISFLTPNPVSTVAIRHRIVQGFLGPFVSGPTNFNAVRDPHGFDQFSFSSDSLCTNSKNTDSDGDGCPDAVEASGDFRPTDLTSSNNLADADEGDVDGTGVPLDGPSGSQTTQNATVAYANSGVENCNDLDGDGVPDSVDLDDDNDGILDHEECGDPNIDGSRPIDFSRIAIVSGDASFNGANPDTIELTPDTGSNAGTAMSTFQIDFTEDFTLSYELNFGSNNDNNAAGHRVDFGFGLVGGADGITVIFHNDPNGATTVGEAGAGIGASGIANGIAIEFDTFDNTIFGGPEGLTSPPANRGPDHTSIWDTDDGTNPFGGGPGNPFNPIAGTSVVELGEIEDGLFHDVVINWDVSTTTLTWSFDGVNVGTLVEDIPTTRLAGTSAFFGLSASTGALRNQHQVTLESFVGNLIFCDTDQDGIPDYQDLDSDGDGCPDAVEGNGSFLPSDLVAAGGIIQEGNTGSSFNGTASGVLLNLGNTVNTNGQVTEVDGNTVPLVNQTVGFAQALTVNTCTDTDGDGIADIDDLDDDNDGILDVDEKSSGPVDFTGVTQQTSTTNPSTEVLSINNISILGTTTSVDLTANLSPSGNGARILSSENLGGIEVLRTTINSGDGVPHEFSFNAPISNLEFVVYDLDNDEIVAFEASYGGVEVPITLANNITLGANVTEFNGAGSGIYIGTALTNTFDSGANQRVTLNLDGPIDTLVMTIAEGASSERNFGITIETLTACDDLDGDGIDNTLDLDSDGDGCPDAVEAGVAPTTGIGQATIENGTGGAVTTTTTNVDNAQFIFDQTTNSGNDDTNNDGLLDSIDNNGGSGTLDGTPEYTSSYTSFALDENVDACLDSDGDTIADVFDLDDDNDGVLDVDEANCIATSIQPPISGVGIPWTGSSTSTITTTAGNMAINNISTIDVEIVPVNSFQPKSIKFDSSNRYLRNNSGTRTFSWSPAIPADEIVLFLIDFDRGNYIASLSVTGVANTSSFELYKNKSSTSSLLDYSQSDGSFTINTPNSTTGNANISGFIVGNSTDLVDSITLTYTGGISSDAVAIALGAVVCTLDADMDGIPNILDLDSDGDGCPDAIEGDLSFEQTDLSDASTTLLNQPNNNNNDGSITTGYLGSTTESVLFNLGTTVDTDPMSPTYGVPLSTLANTPNTQGIGGSQDVGDDTSCCDIVPPMIAPN